MKDWRASQRADGSILARLSPQEWAVIVESRRPAAGRHHAGLSQVRILAGLIVKGIAIGVLSYPLGVMVNVMIR